MSKNRKPLKSTLTYLDSREGRKEKQERNSKLNKDQKIRENKLREDCEFCGGKIDKENDFEIDDEGEFKKQYECHHCLKVLCGKCTKSRTTSCVAGFHPVEIELTVCKDCKKIEWKDFCLRCFSCALPGKIDCQIELCDHCENFMCVDCSTRCGELECDSSRDGRHRRPYVCLECTRKCKKCGKCVCSDCYSNDKKCVSCCCV